MTIARGVERMISIYLKVCGIPFPVMMQRGQYPALAPARPPEWLPFRMLCITHSSVPFIRHIGCNHSKSVALLTVTVEYSALPRAL